jgi:cytidylate kinase
MIAPRIIAIDGPAASGKTTLALELAHRLNYLYFDTGIMYRAVTVAVLRRKIDALDEASVVHISETVEIDIAPPRAAEDYNSTVFLDGEDVTLELRTPLVDAYVSIVSAYAGVRDAMTRQQRRIGERGQVVMVGRDIGTVVLPEADLKVYLDANLEERAHRRWVEEQQQGQSQSLEDTLEAMRKRDEVDRHRSVAPLRPAEDAIILDTTKLGGQDVLQRILEIVDAMQNTHPHAVKGPEQE